VKVTIEEILALEAEIAVISMNLSRLAAKSEFLSEKLVKLLENNGVDIFDTGEPTSAYVNQDR
jgi:hypothetical protein|tara:strand:- start:1325 stop:1513 length:189 start_codon:yes stop_codon:yes gene_type:complete